LDLILLAVMTRVMSLIECFYDKDRGDVCGGFYRIGLRVGGLQEPLRISKTIKVNIPSCLCQNISTTLRFTLSHIEGVKAVLANPITQSAIITFDDEKTSYDQIKDTLIRDRVYIVGEPEYLKWPATEDPMLLVLQAFHLGFKLIHPGLGGLSKLLKTPRIRKKAMAHYRRVRDESRPLWKAFPRV